MLALARMMHFLSENPIVAKIQYGVRRSSPLIYIASAFADAFLAAFI